MDKERLGKEIKRWRKIRGFTQKTLAEDVCHQSEISRLETGEVFPSIDVLHLLARKLKIPSTYFFEVLIHDDVEYKETFKEEILTLSKNKDYMKIFQMIDEVLQQKETIHPELKKFLLWQYYIAAYTLKKINPKSCITELNLLLKKDTYGTDVFLDLDIKNSLANILAENNEFSESDSIYEDILNEKVVSKSINLLKIKCNYNYGKSLFLRQKYNQALQYTNQGIALSQMLNDMSLIGHLFYQKAYILESIGADHGVISSNFKKALLFFDLLELTYHKRILIEKKKQYIE